MSDRFNLFKNRGKNAEEMRNRRVECTIELRKQKITDQYMKKRNIVEDDSNIENFEFQSQSEECDNMGISEIIYSIFRPEPHIQLQATQAARMILSRRRNPPIKKIIDIGIVPRLVQFLSCHDNPVLQFEATWALTNIASGNSDETKVVVNSGAVPGFVQLLLSPHLNVAEQAVWAIGNISGDGPELRDIVLKHNVIPHLLDLCEKNIPMQFLRNVAWTLSNLCRHKCPPPPIEVIARVIPTLNKLLLCEDKEVIIDACWAISFLTELGKNVINNILGTNTMKRVAELLVLDDSALTPPTLRCIGNIVSGNMNQTDYVLNLGVLVAFPRLLEHSKHAIQREAVWAISNILAGSISQIQKVIDENLLPHLKYLLINGDFKTQREAIHAVGNFCSGGSESQIERLLQDRFLRPICDLLMIKDAQLLIVLLQALYNILETFQTSCREDVVKVICLEIEEYGGLEKLDHLHDNANLEIYRLVLLITKIVYQVVGLGHSEVEADSTLSPNSQMWLGDGDFSDRSVFKD